MVREHALLYFASRVSAAAINLAAVSILSRLANSDVYGGSLLVFSWGFILFGFLGQWLGASFFAVYDKKTAAAQVTAIVGLAAVAIGVAGLGLSLCAVLGQLSWQYCGTVFAVVSGLLLFVTATEAQRTRLEAASVALMYLLRALLVIIFGSGALVLGGGSLALACALALANIVASLPGLFRLGPLVVGVKVDRATVNQILGYGWPLILAFGAMALGQNVDRLVLAHVTGTAELGPYGATSDFLKQGFGVICEAITLASMSVAKDAVRRGDPARVTFLLQDAFRALAGTVAFGTVFMLTFADEFIDVIFGTPFRSTAHAILPWLIAANAMLVLRAFYFGQAIYFGQSSRNEVIASFLMIVCTAVLAYALIPRFGIYGAAVAATVGQAAACATFAAARPRLPVPVMSLLVILAAAAVAMVLCIATDHIGWIRLPAAISIKLLILLVAAGSIMRFYDIFGIWDVARTFARNRWPIQQE